MCGLQCHSQLGTRERRLCRTRDPCHAPALLCQEERCDHAHGTHTPVCDCCILVCNQLVPMLTAVLCCHRWKEDSVPPMHTVKLLFEAVYRVVSQEPVLLEVSPSPVYIIGDIHGNYHVCPLHLTPLPLFDSLTRCDAPPNRTCTSSWTSLDSSAVARLCLPSFSSLVVCFLLPAPPLPSPLALMSLCPDRLCGPRRT